jgi:hypothetical protein
VQVDGEQTKDKLYTRMLKSLLLALLTLALGLVIILLVGCSETYQPTGCSWACVRPGEGGHTFAFRVAQ